MPRISSLPQDPASTALTEDAVVSIHKMHLDGVAWADIANRIGTSRKNVQRIVQGRRWEHLHPSARPELYDGSQEQKIGWTPEQIDLAWKVAREAFRDALTGMRS